MTGELLNYAGHGIYVLALISIILCVKQVININKKEIMKESKELTANCEFLGLTNLIVNHVDSFNGICECQDERGCLYFISKDDLTV
jgi:hypothetical protein